jgi:preprotein translocase SecE subunit
MAYRKDQGRMARMAAFWSLAILCFYGCTSLQTYIPRLPGIGSRLGRPIGGLRIPILGLELTGALLITVVVLAGGLVLLHRWLEKPRNAELLIETESELRKVTWPTIDEAVKSSIVVIVCVVLLMAFLAGADFVLGQWAVRILV